MNAKELYEKMVDYKRFAMVLLAVGAFFYLGVIIPSEKPMMDLYMMICASTLLLSGSILFFNFSKQMRKKLMEMEEGEEYLMKK
ncbi:YrhC family protein [Cytobacillus sp. FJAT-54145]|uniref:YrhC family protein n=1 Tax=Cytobacillus spartinae TaxID=3299023 RepID=A0ABW6KG69_9BACI